ncbi:MAG TPA: hypothetical protein PLZ51_11825, partial [Aggregatilineales bacterium]|nr:hypothetical protein [Aggregatilineales bacterium]
TSYQIQIAEDNAFAQIIGDETITTTTFDFGFYLAGDYFWRVRAKTADFNAEWVTRQLIIAPLPAPTLIAPADMMTSTNGEVTFSWDAVPDADSYMIQFSLDNTLDGVIFGDKTATTTYT